MTKVKRHLFGTVHRSEYEWSRDQNFTRYSSCTNRVRLAIYIAFSC